MNVSLGRALSTLALSAGLVVSTAGTASAETLAAKDARGDVLAYTLAADSDEGTAAPKVQNNDVLRTAFQHRTHRVAVRVKYADLRRRGDVFGQSVRIVTNEGVRRDVEIYAGPMMWRGQADMTRPNGTPVVCDVTHRIDYDNDVVVVSFPRTCAGDPRWVRMGVGGYWMNGSKGYLDDAQRPGRVSDFLKLSPRVRRG